MSRTLGHRLTIGGVAGLVLGTGPLLLIIAIDPQSNPVGPGLLAFFTFWPSIGCLLAGIGVTLAAPRPRTTRPSDDERESGDAFWRDRAA